MLQDTLRDFHASACEVTMCLAMLKHLKFLKAVIGSMVRYYQKGCKWSTIQRPLLTFLQRGCQWWGTKTQLTAVSSLAPALVEWVSSVAWTFLGYRGDSNTNGIGIIGMSRVENLRDLVVKPHLIIIYLKHIKTPYLISWDVKGEGEWWW